jgi:hypothetical protein
MSLDNTLAFGCHQRVLPARPSLQRETLKNYSYKFPGNPNKRLPGHRHYPELIGGGFLMFDAFGLRRQVPSLSVIFFRRRSPKTHSAHFLLNT